MATKLWVDERDNPGYNYDTDPNAQPGTFHYTQVVWADSNKLGCASQLCGNDMGTLIVCVYAPGGNFNFQTSSDMYKVISLTTSKPALGSVQLCHIICICRCVDIRKPLSS